MFLFYCHCPLQMLFVFLLCLWLVVGYLVWHSLLISNVFLHHARCFYSVDFPNFMFTPFYCVRAMRFLEKQHFKITIITIIIIQHRSVALPNNNEN